jgi:signal transduction histidine kinase
MPFRAHPGESSGPGRGRHPHRPSWHGAWNEELAAEWEPRFRLSAWSRLWLPVLLSFVAQVPAAVALWRYRGLPQLSDTDPRQLLIGVGLALLGPLALIAARRFPGPVVAVVAVAASLDLLLVSDGLGPPYLALAFAIGSAVIRGARLWAWISVAVTWIGSLSLAAFFSVSWLPGRIAATTLGILVVFGLSEAIRSRREGFRELRRRVADRKQTELQAERVRIARELHDVLAHSLSQINVQAGVGLHLLDRQPDKARDALASIKETSKTALDEVRSVLGVLRAEDGADPGAPLVPEPDLARLPGLVSSVSSQGVQVELSDTTTDVPKPVQLALYRIVQESLTNIVRHAGASRATVTVDETDRDYHAEIVDNGSGAHPSTAGGGRGLLGMRERAELLGGALVAGPRPGGGFAVSATIPKEHS